MPFLTVTLSIVDFEDLKLWLFCSAYFVHFNKCWLVQKDSDHIVLSVSISSPKHVVQVLVLFVLFVSKSLLLTGECHKWSHYFLLESLAYSHVQIMSSLLEKGFNCAFSFEYEYVITQAYSQGCLFIMNRPTYNLQTLFSFS